MEQVLAHFREYQMAYIIVTVCLLPILYFTRRYSLPLIFYTIEIIIYLVGIHVSMWVLVTVTRWFKEQSSMRALQNNGRPVDAPDWGTPLLEFWNRELYTPEWLVWVEVVLALVVMMVVLKYRPMRVQRKRGWHFDEKKQKKQAAAKARTLPKTQMSSRGASRGGRR